MSAGSNPAPNGARLPRALLRWYDAHARVLPWRIGPAMRKAGAAPDPYAVWLSEIMLQQTTVATVAPRYDAFLTRWPDVRSMAAAALEDVLSLWAGLGYYARARNLHKCAGAVVNRHGGIFPDTEEVLKTLPGVGDYTAAAIAAIAFDRRAIVVDGNVERVVARLFVLDEAAPQLKQAVRERAEGFWPKKRSGDFAQSLMDLGATVCKPRAPVCGACPVARYCAARANGRESEYPKKAAKTAKPTRYGAAFALSNRRGELLFEQRPEKGLLGGMYGLPGSAWDDAPDNLAGAPCKADWRRAGEVTHTFTHFHLRLDVYCAAAPSTFRPRCNQRWLDPAAAGLPTVMKKAAKVALDPTGP